MERHCILAVYQQQSQIAQAVYALLENGIAQQDISVIGTQFQTRTRVIGFLYKRNVALDGLKSGAMFGSLSGTFWGQLRGIGVLFVPMLGPVVVAGPLGAALLGAATGRAIAHSARPELVAALVALGMPTEKAALYQACIQAGDFVLVVEVLSEQALAIRTLVETQGGTEVLICDDMTIPRQPDGLLETPVDLSPEIRSHLSEEAQQTFIWAYNEEFLYTEDADAATLKAWEVVETQYHKDDDGLWAEPKGRDLEVFRSQA